MNKHSDSDKIQSSPNHMAIRVKNGAVLLDLAAKDSNETRGLLIQPDDNVHSDINSTPKGLSMDSQSQSVLTEANSYVEYVMVQPICAVMRTPVSTRRKRCLSAPSADSTVKKRKNKHCDKSQNEDELNENDKISDSDSDDSEDVHDLTLLKGTSDKRNRRTRKARRELKSTPVTDSNCEKGSARNKLNQKAEKEGTTEMKSENRSTNSYDTEMVLNAVKDLKVSIDKRFDEMQTENKSAIKQLHDQIHEVKKEFNTRMEGLSKKVETKVNQNMEKNINDKVKTIKKDIDTDITKITRQIKDTRKDVDRIKETLLPTVQERLGDEIDELRGTLNNLQAQMKDRNHLEVKKHSPEDNRHRNIIIRNMPERENENTKSRVNGLIQDSLRLKDISVVAAERKPSKTDTKPGIIVATMKSNEEKQVVMKHKRNLMGSSRYSKVFIENDIPANQRAVNSNFRTIINALGGNRLQLKGSRISFRSEDSVSSTGNSRDSYNYSQHLGNETRHSRRYENSERRDGYSFNNRDSSRRYEPRREARGERYNY